MSVTTPLSNIILKRDSFCSLCFASIDQAVHTEDEVVVKISNDEQNLAVSVIIQTILGDGMLEYLSSLNSMCENCTKTLISCYTFIYTSKNNAEVLIKMIDCLSNNLSCKEEKLKDVSSVFMYLNPENFTCENKYSRTYTETKKPVKGESPNNKLAHKAKESENIIKKNKLLFKETMEMCYKNEQNLIKCKVCSKVYPHIWSFKNHYLRVHAPKSFKCPQCPLRYGSKAFLKAHRTESHCSIVCSECGKVFNNRNTLKVHEIKHFGTIVCPDCGRVYKSISTFKKHKELQVCGRTTRASPSEAQYTCDYCNKKYTQKVSLRVHIQYEHGNYKAHICEWCGKKFWAQSRLKAHIVKHTKEKNYPCNMCNGKFVSKESLLYHTRIHTGEKPYACDQCNSRFLSASRRSEHIKRHHIGANLNCNICNAKFNSWSYLHKHKRSHDRLAGNGKVEKANKELKTNTDKEEKTKRKSKNIPSGATDVINKGEQSSSTTEVVEDVKVYLEVSDDEGDSYVINIAGWS